MSSKGTMTCIDHTKHVKGHPQTAHEPFDSAELVQVLTRVCQILASIGAKVESVGDAIRKTNLSVHVDAPIVNAQVLPAPVTVQIDKQLAPIVNVQVPETKIPDVHVDNHPPSLDLVARVNYDDKKPAPLIYVLIPTAFIALDIVVRLLHL